MQHQLAIGIDLGGTNIKAVLINADGSILAEAIRPTHDQPGKDNSAVWKQTVKELVQQLQQQAGRPVEKAGIAAPGTANTENTAILSLPNRLLGIENLVWKDYLAIDTLVLNDAHAALFAESRIGAGKIAQNIVMLTLGTGVGGGIMLNGQILQGQMGRAGHIGHISVTDDLEQSIAQAPGSLERAIGECTIRERTYGKYTSTEALVKAYLAGDAFAAWAWLNSVHKLSRGLVSLINLVSPDLIILSGGITQAAKALLEPLHQFMDLYEWRIKGFETPIVVAQSNTFSGAIGAALFALEKNSIS